MAVFVIAEIEITDDSWVPDYAANVHGIVEQYGGRYLSRSGNIETLEGEAGNETLIAVIQFPSREDAVAFATSDAYAPYGKARQDGSKSYFRLIDDTDIAGAIPYLGKPG